eukprot:CAMPEP_0195130276 /NCGR_PEP_ID=MMETSP0448-20130528/142945_1 /TAXON_ID=66468 /ORGANISM="Heterocapsa triquestra, Strain CCMP 448" /LENGTH=73 /DNA_ID=CAMNT_0040168173 /DNA_START=84 /DNA_END=301 /DNA_ORIENTATION=+
MAPSKTSIALAATAAVSGISTGSSFVAPTNAPEASRRSAAVRGQAAEDDVQAQPQAAVISSAGLGLAVLGAAA